MRDDVIHHQRLTQRLLLNHLHASDVVSIYRRSPQGTVGWMIKPSLVHAEKLGDRSLLAYRKMVVQTPAVKDRFDR
jgi:hypothetical protein